MNQITNKDAVVRPLGHGDADLLYAFFLSLSEATRKSFRPHPFDRATAEHFTEEELGDANIRRFLAIVPRENGEAAAGYAFFWDWTTGAPSLGIAVSDAFQGRGVGRLLMRFLMDEAVRCRKKALRLTTDKNNTRAQALYLSCGFRILGEGKEDDYLMRLDFPGVS